MKAAIMFLGLYTFFVVLPILAALLGAVQLIDYRIRRS